MSWTGPLTLLAALATSQAPDGGLYQDFRGERPLLAGLKVFGTVLGGEANAEPGGLRFTLSPDRKSNHPVGVGTKFSLTGDFELTLSYDLFSATQPTEGYGSGVNLSVATDGKREKFAKVGRFMRPKEGSVYMTEFWKNAPKKEYQAKSFPTDVKAGKLRLAREGEIIRCLVADDPPDQFRELWKGNFGTDELKVVHAGVIDGGKPGNAVDVRLLDYRIGSGKIPAEAAQVPAEPPAPPPARPQSGALWGAVAGLGALVLVVCIAGGFLVWRRMSRRSAVASQPAASAVETRCPKCDKRLKLAAGAAGKRVKCPGCAASFTA